MMNNLLRVALAVASAGGLLLFDDVRLWEE